MWHLDETPGPGPAVLVEVLFTRYGKHFSPKYSMRCKCPPLPSYRTPAPSDYKAEGVRPPEETNAPVWSMRRRFRYPSVSNSSQLRWHRSWVLQHVRVTIIARSNQVKPKTYFTESIDLVWGISRAIQSLNMSCAVFEGRVVLNSLTATVTISSILHGIKRKAV
jgi:hypothetical protein